MTNSPRLHRVSQKLRVIAVGSLPPSIRALCVEIDPDTAFLASVELALPALAQRVSPDDAVVVVSITLDSLDCRLLLSHEVRLRETCCLGFVVNPDPSFVEDLLGRLRCPRPSPTNGASAAFLDDRLVGLGVSSVEDCRGAGLNAQQAAFKAKQPLGSAFFYGHSNGQCHGAGNIVICQRDRHNPRLTTVRQLPCFGSAPCRFDDKGDFERVRADDLRTEVIIDFTCFGYVLEDHTLLACDAVGKAMLENTCLRALVSSLVVFTPTPHDFRLAAYLAHDGCEMGRLAGLLNRARVLDPVHSAAFICLGDPRTRLARGVVDAGTMSLTEEVVDRPTESSGSTCDLTVRTTPAQDEVMLYSGATSAAWAPDGRVYLTLSCERSSATLWRVPMRVLTTAVSFEPLLSHLDFLEHYLASIRNQRINAANLADNIELAAALANAESMRCHLRRTGVTVNPTRIRNGSVLDANELANLEMHRLRQLESLSRCLLQVHRHTLTDRGLLFSAGAEALLSTEPEQRGPACAYCGSGTTHTRQRLAGSAFVRTQAFCDLCGRIFTGSHSASVIDVHTHGRQATVQVMVTNPFPFDVPVHGIAGLQTFAGRHEPLAEFKPLELKPGTAGRLETLLTIPDEVPPGLHRLRAAIALGPQVELLIRNHLVPAEANIRIAGTNIRFPLL